MDVDVAERAQAVDAGTVEVDSPSLGAGKAREVGEAPTAGRLAVDPGPGRG